MIGDVVGVRIEEHCPLGTLFPGMLDHLDVSNGTVVHDLADVIDAIADDTTVLATFEADPATGMDGRAAITVHPYHEGGVAYIAGKLAGTASARACRRYVRRSDSSSMQTRGPAMCSAWFGSRRMEPSSNSCSTAPATLSPQTVLLETCSYAAWQRTAPTRSPSSQTAFWRSGAEQPHTFAHGGRTPTTEYHDDAMMCDTIDVYVAHHCIHQSSNVLILSFFAYVCANIKSVLQCSSTRFANACNGATREHGEGRTMKFSTRAIAFLGATAMLIPLAACGGGSSNSGQPSQESNVKEIDVWAWDPSLKQIAADYEKKTGIKVNLKNVGTNTKEYTQLDNAIEAGSGAPDVAQIEYYALPQYRDQGNLLDITDKTSGYEDFYNPGPWSSVQIDGKVYALPIDAGPMAFFYNKEIFDKAGVDGEKIKTWDDYYEAAKKIHALGDEYYITSDSGDAGFFDSMTWLAGGKPFQTTNNGKDVTINLTGDNGVKEFEKFWQKLLDEKLLDTKTVGWSEDWFKGMQDGTIASLLTGAWMPGNLVNSAPAAAGKWRVALMPTPNGRKPMRKTEDRRWPCSSPPPRLRQPMTSSSTSLMAMA